METISMAQFGMGPIGVESVKLAATKPWARLVGAIDIDPKKVGRSLAELTGVESLGDCRVYQSFEELCGHIQPRVVLHTAGSGARRSIAQITPMARQGVSVASSCEELLYPQHRAPDESIALDSLCRRTGSRVVGTGVNPGFVMDVLPVCMTGVSRSVEGIYAERVVNASTRRMPLQKKIGSGMDPDEFRRLFREGKAGHAGFQESAQLVAHCMGWRLDELIETCEPVIADHDIQTDYFQVRKGLTCGLHQHCIGKVDGRIRIEFDLKMYLDAPNPHDAVRIEGDPPLDLVVRNGVAGDGATVAALVNAVPRLLAAPAGLRLMTDLAVPCWTP